MKTTITAESAKLLDKAHGLRFRGENDAALRLALSMLEAMPSNVGAALVATAVLVDAQQVFVAGDAAERLVDAFIRRGDLPTAVVAARLAATAGVDATPLFQAIAKAFGKGSKRTADVAPAPPPLPAILEDASVLDTLNSAGLISHAEKCLTVFSNTPDTMPQDGKVPTMPLFSAIEPAALAQFLRTLEIRNVADDEWVVREGDEGKEAFVVVRGALHALREGDDDTDETVLAVLGPGSIVGEMALVSDSPRSASLHAREPSILLVASRDALESLAQKTPVISEELGAFCRARMVANLMRHSAILGAVSPEKRQALIGRFETRTFAPGEVLVKKGEETRGLYLIATGTVSVSSDDADGDEVVIADLGPGDVVGEISLVLRRPATATVTAQHATVALELTRAQFHEAIREHSTLLSELYDLATKREEETRSVVAQESMDAAEFLL